jgi:hypothetical protein
MMCLIVIHLFVYILLNVHHSDVARNFLCGGGGGGPANISLNIDKTVFMPISISKTDCKFYTIAVHGCVNNKICNQENYKIIKIVGKIRYLGVILDNKLKWNFHINNLLGKLRFITFKLIKLKNMVLKPIIKIVYFHYINQISNMVYWFRVAFGITY